MIRLLFCNISNKTVDISNKMLYNSSLIDKSVT